MRARGYKLHAEVIIRFAAHYLPEKRNSNKGLAREAPAEGRKERL